MTMFKESALLLHFNLKIDQLVLEFCLKLHSETTHMICSICWC